jgi:nucleotide-binding universal stress UspA family protein
MGHIVVGVDETPEAAAALRWAANEAAVRGWRLTALLAWDLLSQHHRDPGESFTPRYSEADAREALDVIVERTLGRDVAQLVERQVVCDLPAHALLDAACDADLLVVGTRELHGLRRVLAGSVSWRCRRHAPCPMVIVHGDGRAEAVASMSPRSATV